MLAKGLKELWFILILWTNTLVKNFNILTLTSSYIGIERKTIVWLETCCDSSKFDMINLFAFKITLSEPSTQKILPE